MNKGASHRCRSGFDFDGAARGLEMPLFRRIGKHPAHADARHCDHTDENKRFIDFPPGLGLFLRQALSQTTARGSYPSMNRGVNPRYCSAQDLPHDLRVVRRADQSLVEALEREAQVLSVETQE